MHEPDADLVAAFRADLGERRGRIAALWDLVRAGDRHALEALLRDVHYLAGAAATFGAADVGEAAGRAEAVLWPALRNGTPVPEGGHAAMTGLIAALSAAAG